MFINYIEEDQNIVDKICDLLSTENISYTLMPFDEDMGTLLGMAQQIEDTIQNRGAIISVLSENSIKNFRFISNVQYGCEKALRRTVLAVYEVDKTMDNPLELYYGQAAVINAVNKADDFLDKLLENIKIILGCKDIPEEIHPKGRAQRVVRKIAIALIYLAIIIGVSWIVVPMITGANLEVPEVIATPVVFENPYAGESLDQGIVIDRRYVPKIQDHSDPASQAPFHFMPSEIYHDFTFDDPSLENVLDHSFVDRFAMKIMDEDKLIIQQDNGVLRYSIAPQDSSNKGDFWFPYTHLFNSGDLEYIGIRFRVDEYQGWTDAKQVITADFSLFSMKDCMKLIDINLSQQYVHTPLSSTNNIGDIGSHWHTLEFVPVKNSDQLDVYLDGGLIGQSQKMPDKPTYVNLVLSFVVDYSTDWVNFLVDEVVWGGETPQKLAETPEEAEYHFTSDEIIYQYTMDYLPPEDIFQNGGAITSLKNGGA